MRRDASFRKQPSTRSNNHDQIEVILRPGLDSDNIST
jgi:hypothetical protein